MYVSTKKAVLDSYCSKVATQHTQLKNTTQFPGGIGPAESNIEMAGFFFTIFNRKGVINHSRSLKKRLDSGFMVSWGYLTWRKNSEKKNSFGKLPWDPASNRYVRLFCVVMGSTKCPEINALEPREEAHGGLFGSGERFWTFKGKILVPLKDYPPAVVPKIVPHIAL